MKTILASDPAVTKLRAKAAEFGFTMSCDDLTGCLLRTLTASKPAGTLLELGTVVGVGSIPEQWRELLALIERRGHELTSSALDWSTGILTCTRRST